MKPVNIILKKISCFACFMALLSGSAAGQGAPSPADDKGLKEFYANYFPIGVAVSPGVIKGPEADLIRQHFNSITAENAMKMGPIHPQEDRFNWGPADAIVDFAQRNGMRMRGHTLCWHNQAPDWLFTGKDGNTVSKEILLARLKDHITQVVTRYKGKIYAWDVVNEVIDDAPGKVFRDSKWYAICGEEFIALAFQYAHAADPNAILFYNDYNTESASKRDKIYNLLKRLKDEGVPVHGVGLQGHWSVDEPAENELRASIEKFASLGLSIQITELDVSVYPSEHSRREPKTNEPNTFTPAMEEKQVAQYKMFFKVFREYKNTITGVTFWNVSDKHSWLDSFPVEGRKNYPLLFDQKLKPKKAYWEVVKF